MFKNILCSLFVIILFISDLYSNNPKIWDNWYFGRNAGMTFNTTNRIPATLNDGKLYTLEGCASISDPDGNLLFYTNGVYVYNKNHDIMINGVDLKGHNSSTQSALILKKPGSQNIFYIFTTDKGPYEGESEHEHCFSIVDMNEDEGRGAVIVKNMVLHSPVVEKLTAVRHANNEDYWIIARGMNDNKFIISLLSEGGIVDTKIFNIGPTYFPFPASPEFSLGQMKFNPKGDLMGNVVYGANNLELYRFDNSSGVFTGYLGIPVQEEVTALYGLEFSSNNKFVYVNNLFGRIYQFDVSEFDSLKISNSLNLVYDSLDFSFQEFGQMQLAPNGKIYMALSYDTMLAVIDKPNVPSPYCRFNKRAFGLNGALSLFGLPNNIITGTYYSVDIYGREICLGDGDSLELFSIVYPEDEDYVYDWTGPNGFRSNLPNPVIPKAGLANSGKYVCRVSVDGQFFQADSTIINVYDYPVAEISGPNTICPPEIIKLSSRYKAPEYIYEWSNGSNESEILINSPGRYWLLISNPAGCPTDTVFVDIDNADNLSIIFEDETTICSGQGIELSLDKDIYTPLRDYKFKWATGDTTASIFVNKAGFYSVTVTRSGGCSGTDSVYVNEVESPVVDLNLKDTIRLCSGEITLLYPNDTNSVWKYIWADGYPELSREISQSGYYKMYVTNQGYCMDSASVMIIFYDNPVADIEYNNSLILCYGDSVNLVSKFAEPDYNYFWSTGSNEQFITVKESGKYKLIITNQFGCKDSSEVEVFVAEEINLTINADKSYLCLNDSLTLQSNSRYKSYKWSTGDTTDFIRVYSAGKYELIVENDYGCKDTAEVVVTDISLSAEFSKRELRIDSLCVGDLSLQELEIIYNSSEVIEFTDFEYFGDDFVFDVNQTIDNVSEGVYVHNVSFTPGLNKPGIYNGEIVITIEKPCYSRFSIPIYLKVYSNFEFSAPEMTAAPGDKICIPINVKSTCGNSGDIIYSPEFSLDMIPEHFFPESVNGGILLEKLYLDSIRTLRLKMDESAFPAGTSRNIEVCGTVLVGKEAPSPILIKDIDLNSDFIHYTISQGSLSIEGCFQDYRIIKTYKPLNMKISPNPVRAFTEIIIESQEVGKHFVDIYSVDGRLIESYELNSFENMNLQIIQINPDKYIQGIYQVVLKSPWNIITERILVIKD
ncbi:MAG: T9SS type A sorting domain-containing protein [Candidatus Kapabacteria bacterium]|nr:T9SS type A sorting domain-containing protein [Ignavibacteriota bacterium]MCW5885718.1 T9SS type A sorting domain-containing protein [Candidatus Kapabacteria bacterium]